MNSGTIPQTDLPRLSATLQHNKKDGIRTKQGQREGTKKKKQVK